MLTDIQRVTTNRVDDPNSSVGLFLHVPSCAHVYVFVWAHMVYIWTSDNVQKLILWVSEIKLR